MLSLNVLMLRRATLIRRKRDRVRARQIQIWGGVEVRRTGDGVQGDELGEHGALQPMSNGPIWKRGCS